MKLIFVYNANSGVLEKIIDGAHKIVSPSTYDCNLCAITFGKFTEDGLWKDFRENTAVTMEFLYKDKFLQNYDAKNLQPLSFPAILLKTATNLELFISSEILNKMTSSEELIKAIKKCLTPY
ncbi:MAG: GTPase [Bacteroidetes bacterium]|nr:MAG: GTPase [Bacteroidota bacterium]